MSGSDFIKFYAEIGAEVAQKMTNSSYVLENGLHTKNRYIIKVFDCKKKGSMMLFNKDMQGYEHGHKDGHKNGLKYSTVKKRFNDY